MQISKRAYKKLSDVEKGFLLRLGKAMRPATNDDEDQNEEDKPDENLRSLFMINMMEEKATRES